MALFGLTLPFLAAEDGAPRCDLASGADSVAVSGQKALGVVMPCGIALARRSLSDATNPCSVECAKINKDTTISGMRNGRIIVALWGSAPTRHARGKVGARVPPVPGAGAARGAGVCEGRAESIQSN